jgi:hypothetical protein
MATAIEMLIAAGGERSLFGRIGRWRQFISKQVDAFVAGGSSLPDFAWSKRASSDQVGVGLNTTIDFNGVGSFRGITKLNNDWILNEGKRYRLSVVGRMANFSDATGGNIKLQFVDGANVVLSDLTLDSPDAFFRPNTSTVATSTAAGLEMIYTVPTNATANQRSVRVRCTGATGTADVPSNGMTFVIEEIPGGV